MQIVELTELSIVERFAVAMQNVELAELPIADYYRKDKIIISAVSLLIELKQQLLHAR